MPKMLPLGGASWVEVKSEGVDFWKYTAELDALYNDEYFGYTLDAGQSVKWIESTLGSAYQLSSNPAAKGENIGLIVYDMSVNTINSGGDLSADSSVHRECVLFKS